MSAAKLLAVALLAGACSSALNDPSPVAQFAPGEANGRTAAQLIAEADAAWQHRDEPGKASQAQGLYVDAATADARGVAGLLGAMHALSFRIEYEPGVAKAKLASEEVQLGQWCQQRAPTSPECDYRLAIALGQEARENVSMGRDAIKHVVELLHRAIARDPRLDEAGPHRVLSILLVRAPGWPIGPGDTDEGVAEATKAVELAPESAANQLVLAEALLASGDQGKARAAYQKAATLAAVNPDKLDGARQLVEARSGLEKTGG
jgi:tetratricopeptide (TPR) repeat protein